MCEPTTIAVAGAAVVGGVMQGVAAKNAADAEAAAGRRNAIIAEQAASDALARGAEAAGDATVQGAALGGQQTSGYAASGVLVEEGSAARTLQDTAALTAMDKERINNNAQREAWGLEVEADNMRDAADRAEDAGQNALLSGIIGGLAQGASSGISAARTTGYFNPNPTPPGK